MFRSSSVRLSFALALGWFLALPASFAAEPAAGKPDADAITLLRDLAYDAAASKTCTLDLALPQLPPGEVRPLIVVIHGGGWIEGDKSSFSSAEHPMPGNILDFARAGFVAATINYRLSREAPYPAALDDCRSAVRWLRAHARAYHVDSQRVGAYGNSAGGHLALLLGMTEPRAGEKLAGPAGDESSRAQAVVSDSGPLDMEEQYATHGFRGTVDQFMGGPPEGARLAQYREASPVHQVTDHLPPLLLIYGASDSQISVRAADRFVEAVGRSKGNDLSYFRLAGVDHCPHSLVRIGYLQPVVCDFFTRTLRGKVGDSR